MFYEMERIDAALESAKIDPLEIAWIAVGFNYFRALERSRKVIEAEGSILYKNIDVVYLDNVPDDYLRILTHPVTTGRHLNP